MDIVSKYTALLGQQKLKESFVKDLELVLSRKNPNIEKGKLNFIRYSELESKSNSSDSNIGVSCVCIQESHLL